MEHYAPSNKNIILTKYEEDKAPYNMVVHQNTTTLKCIQPCMLIQRATTYK